MNKLKLQILASLLAGLALTGCDEALASAAGEARAEETLLDRELDPAQVLRAKALYEQYCLERDDVVGKGQPGDRGIGDAGGHFPPPPMEDSAHPWHHPTAVLLEMIREGSLQGQGKMPAWKGKLSEKDQQDVVAYIKSLWSDPVYQLWAKIER